jgi:SAM-dependent methyltransferase
LPISSFMNPAEFANIAGSERDFWWYRGMRLILFRMLERYAPGRKIARALEVGCGTGYFASLLQNEHRWPIVAMDISADGLGYAQGLGVRWPVQGDMVSLPFATGAFDMVVSMDALPHLPRGLERAAIAEMARVLEPGGMLIIRAAALDALRSRHSQFVAERQRFTSTKLIDAASESGLRVLQCTYANCLLAPVAFLKFRVLEPLLRSAPASGVEMVPPWLDRLLYVPLVMESRWLGGGGRLPVGQTLILFAEKAR